MSGEVTYRWIEGADASREDWDRIEEIGAARGWMQLTRETTLRVRLAECDGEIIGYVPVQLVPHLEPLYVDKAFRGTGVAEQLADDMCEWLQEIQARGWMAVAEHPAAKRLCEREGAHRVESPVYVYVRGGVS
jgi:GNAT superfamily N-acetyltransferase